MSLLNTRVQNLRVADPNLSKYVTKPSMYGALDLFQRQTNQAGGIITTELQQRALSAVGTTVQIPVFDEESISIGSSRSVTIADSENTSQLYSVTFNLYTFGFTQVPAMFMNNEIGMQQDFNHKLLKYIHQLGRTLDSACITALSTAKNKVWNWSTGYDTTGNIFTAPATGGTRLLADLETANNANDFYGPFDLVVNPGMKSLFETIQTHGLYNDSDQTVQFQGKNIGFSNRISDATGDAGTGYMVNNGSVGLLFRAEREALLGTVMPDGHEWGRGVIPLLNIPCDTYMYQSAGDFNAIAGAATADMTRARKIHYAWAVEMATIVSYNSDTDTYAQPITAFAIEAGV